MNLLTDQVSCLMYRASGHVEPQLVVLKSEDRSRVQPAHLKVLLDLTVHLYRISYDKY